MIRPALLGGALIVSLAVCDASNDVSKPAMVYKAEAILALKNRQDTYNKRRVAIEFESGTKVETCGAYIQLVGETILKEDVNNQISKSEYLICDLLAIVGNKKIEEGGNTGYGERLATGLDLRSFPSSLFQSLDENKYTLTHFGATELQVGNVFVIYETPDWRYKVEVIASLDINHNDKADWVIWLSDEAKNGNYRQYETIIAYDVADVGVFSASQYHPRKSSLLAIYPASVSSADHITITFPKNHPKNVSIRSPGGDWYVVHERAERISLLPYRQFLFATSVRKKVSEIRGVKWLDGKRIVERVFKEPGEYLFYMADNLETEPENTYSMMATIVFK